MKKQTAVLLIVALVIIYGVALALAHHKQPTAPETSHTNAPASNQPAPSTTGSNQQANLPSNDTISGVLEVQSSDPTLQAGNFTIVNKQEPASGWYIITLSPGGGQGDNETVVLKQVGSALQIAIGPGTAFSSSILSGAGVPQAVQVRLNVYND